MHSTGQAGLPLPGRLPGSLLLGRLPAIRSASFCQVGLPSAAGLIFTPFQLFQLRLAHIQSQVRTQRRFSLMLALFAQVRTRRVSSLILALPAHIGSSGSASLFRLSFAHIGSSSTASLISAPPAQLRSYRLFRLSFAHIGSSRYV